MCSMFTEFHIHKCIPQKLNDSILNTHMKRWVSFEFFGFLFEYTFNVSCCIRFRFSNNVYSGKNGNKHVCDPHCDFKTSWDKNMRTFSSDDFGFQVWLKFHFFLFLLLSIKFCDNSSQHYQNSPSTRTNIVWTITFFPFFFHAFILFGLVMRFSFVGSKVADNIVVINEGLCIHDTRTTTIRTVMKMTDLHQTENEVEEEEYGKKRVCPNFLFLY